MCYIPGMYTVVSSLGGDMDEVLNSKRETTCSYKSIAVQSDNVLLHVASFDVFKSSEVLSVVLILFPDGLFLQRWDQLDTSTSMVCQRS